MRDLATEITGRISPIIHTQVTTHLDISMPVETATRFTTAYTATTIRFQGTFHKITKGMSGAVPGTNTRIIHRGLARTLVGDIESLNCTEINSRHRLLSVC